MKKHTVLVFSCCAILALGAHVVGCGDDDAMMMMTGTDGGGPRPGTDAGPPAAFDGSVVPPRPVEGWPTPNAYSWNGTWSPTSFPIAGLLDNEYNDGHVGRDGMVTPILPPGEWDYEDGNNDVANWRNFRSNRGDLERLMDMAGNHYGWRYVPNNLAMPDYSGAVAYFEGSSGTDIVDLGPNSQMHSFGQGNLADGPDILVFNHSYSMHFRTGSTSSGGTNDDDLVVAGCSNHPDGAFEITTTTIHTGPGSDWVFVRDLDRAGIDAGNPNGITNMLDPLDGHDMVVYRGNTHDFRFSGGAGNDVAVWYADDNVQTSMWLGPNFFGGGGWGDAVWGDTGTDRLVMAVPTSTTVVTTTPTPPGGFLVRATDGGLVDDPPTADDPMAHYCVECGTSPTGRKTIIFEYNSASGSVHTGYFFVTAFEELQLGVGPGARVYRIDDVASTITEDATLTPFVPPSFPDEYCR